MELFYSTEVKDNLIILPEAETRHCVKVLRNKAGDTVYVIDGLGSLYRCTLKDVSSKEAVCEIVETLKGEGERPYNLTMAVCPTKNIDRYEWFLEKATEFGIDTLVPIISDHSIRTVVKKERLEAIALSATKQSLKSYLPVIEDTVKVVDFLKRYSEKGAIKLIAHCEEGKKVSFREAFSLRTAPAGCSNEIHDKPKIIIMIGPEGDFSKKEIAEAEAAGFTPITLGKSRLRVETAALAAVCEMYFCINGGRRSL